MIEYTKFEENLAKVQERIVSACLRSGRASKEILLLPVTKNHPATAVEFAIRAGLTAVGENRVQEAAEKRLKVSEDVEYELIGHLQTNKAKIAIETFGRVQSVDSKKILGRLDRLAGEAERVLPILLQCNSGEDPNKYGFRVEEMDEVLELALKAQNLRVDGLMTIAPLDDDVGVAKRAFVRLRELRDRLAEQFGVELKELSMGMTGDLEEAIEAGSTQIRVGSALYGARQY